MKLESAIGSYDFMLDINGMNEFINDEGPSQKKNMFGRNHTKDLQTLLVYTMPWNKKNSEKDVDTYAQFVGDEVCLPYEQDIKLMDRVTKRVKLIYNIRSGCCI